MRTRGRENNENSGYCSDGGSFDRGLDIGRDTAASAWVGCWIGSPYSSAGGTFHIGRMLQLSPSRYVSRKAGWATCTGRGNDRAQRARRLLEPYRLEGPVLCQLLQPEAESVCQPLWLGQRLHSANGGRWDQRVCRQQFWTSGEGLSKGLARSQASRPFVLDLRGRLEHLARSSGNRSTRCFLRLTRGGRVRSGCPEPC